MKKTLFCLLALAAVATTARAQEAPAKNIFGVRAGLSFSSIGITATHDDFTGKEKMTTGNRTSFHVGFVDQIRLGKRLPLYLETGLMLQDKGSYDKEDYREYDYRETLTTKVNMYYLEVPLALSYHIDLGNNFAIAPYAGLYYGFGLGGNEKSSYWSNEYGSETEKEKVFGKDRDFKRSDFGVRLGVGVIFHKHYYLGAGYAFSLTDTDKMAPPVGDGGSKWHTSARNRTWTITLGYNF